MPYTSVNHCVSTILQILMLKQFWIIYFQNNNVYIYDISINNEIKFFHFFKYM